MSKKFRALVKASYADLLIDAENEEDAKNQVSAWMRDKSRRPFDGYLGRLEISIRQPWKKQLKKVTR